MDKEEKEKRFYNLSDLKVIRYNIGNLVTVFVSWTGLISILILIGLAIYFILKNNLTLAIILGLIAMILECLVYFFQYQDTKKGEEFLLKYG